MSFPTDRTPLGVFDLTGNVSEWTQDDAVRGEKPAVEPRRVDPCVSIPGATHRALRGGNWGRGGGRATLSTRAVYARTHRRYDVGFRVALSPASQESSSPPAPGEDARAR
jgi:formylglycine-generating enzyme required for sulfatase activity